MNYGLKKCGYIWCVNVCLSWMLMKHGHSMKALNHSSVYSGGTGHVLILCLTFLASGNLQVRVVPFFILFFKLGTFDWQSTKKEVQHFFF